MRAARLEEENARLRKELEEEKRLRPRAASGYGPVALAVGVVCLGLGVAIVVSTRTRAPIERESVVAAKSLEPSPSAPALPSVVPPDWAEIAHATESNLYGFTHGVKPSVGYAVGAGGTILRHYATGSAWTAEESGTTRDLHGV